MDFFKDELGGRFFFGDDEYHRGTITGTIPSESQVTRDLRHKTSSAGVGFTPAEQNGWQTQLLQFFQPTVKVTSAAKKRAVKKHEVITVPRIATLDWLRTLENSMKFATGKVLRDFDTASLLDTATVENRTVQIEKSALVREKNKVPNMLIINSDRCPTQICGINFLTNKLKLGVVFVPDPSHTAWRAILEGLGKCGHGTTIRIGQLLYNVAYGPFKASGFFRIMAESVHDMSASMTVSDPLLLHYWDKICEDFGWTCEADVGEEGRARFLQNLPLLEPGSLKGPKVSTGRFYSFCDAFRTWDKTHHTKLLIIVFASIRSGWSKTIVDFWKPHSRGQNPTVNTSSRGPAAAASSCAPRASGSTSSTSASSTTRGTPSASASSSTTTGAASSSRSSGASTSTGVGAVLPGAAGKAMTFTEAQDKAKAACNEERFRSRNTLHAVGRMLANEDLTRHLRMVGLAANPLAVDFGKAYKEIKSVEDTKRWYANWAHWSPSLAFRTERFMSSALAGNLSLQNVRVHRWLPKSVLGTRVLLQDRCVASLSAME